MVYKAVQFFEIRQGSGAIRATQWPEIEDTLRHGAISPDKESLCPLSMNDLRIHKTTICKIFGIDVPILVFNLSLDFTYGFMSN